MDIEHSHVIMLYISGELNAECKVVTIGFESIARFRKKGIPWDK